jgi:hypothetical protein
VTSLLIFLALALPIHAQETTDQGGPDQAPAAEQEAPAADEPVEGAAPADDAPAEDAPAAEAAPAEPAPGDAPAAEAAPAEPAPEDAPAAEAAPTEEAPVAEVPVPAETTEELELEAWQKNGWGWGGIPAINYNSDEGFGFGVIGSVYKYNGESRPYKTRIGGLVFFTTKGVQYHYIDVDALDLAAGKLRLTTRVLYDYRFTSNYCGMGGDVECNDPDLARQQMDFHDVNYDDLSEEEWDQQLQRWYQAAFRMPYAIASARYELSEMPHKVEALASYRLSYFAPFAKFDDTLYQHEVDLDAETGFTSVIQGGLMVDNRDNEPAPKKGYWVEGTVRGASKYWGSKFDWFGFNTTLRGYLPILKDGKLTLADRFAFDGIVGETNYKELDWMGGSQFYTAAGGARSLRGIRSERYRGKVKMLNQAELRWKAVTFTPGSTVVDLYFQGFVDAAHVAAEWDDLGGSPIHLGEGGGLRIAINQNFILRGDFATSFDEGWGLTGIYLDVDNLW